MTGVFSYKIGDKKTMTPYIFVLDKGLLINNVMQLRVGRGLSFVLCQGIKPPEGVRVAHW